MASLLWTTVFLLLCAELVFTIILVLPVPRSWRNGICRRTSQMDLKTKLHPILLGVGGGLALVLLNDISFLKFLLQDSAEERRYHYHHNHNHHNDYHAKEREYQTERNLYLAGFALTLIFVIGRITELMQEHVELEDELTSVKKAPQTLSNNMNDGNTTTNNNDMMMEGEGIEMKSFTSSQKKDS